MLTWVEKSIQQRETELCGASRKIWGLAEVKYQEQHSAQVLRGLLEKEGFRVEQAASDLPTSFTATYGAGAPVIGILAEYDALPGLRQDASPVESDHNGNGHGCGHNLLGVGAVGAALAVKDFLDREGCPGTVKLFGCPAEESGGSGKVYMARAGCFDGLDAALSWHPNDFNAAALPRTLANFQARFSFHGRTAHAGMAPEQGRSALDACELMNVGVNYLREHVIQGARIHYAYLNAGLPVANVVPDFAMTHYNVRAPKMSQAKEIFSRIVDIAKGAALMTGTTMEYHVCGGMYDYVPNGPLSKAMHEAFCQVGAPAFDEADMDLARRFRATEPEEKQQALAKRGPVLDTAVPAQLNLDLTMGGSTDVGDVSYIVPTAQAAIACAAVGTGAHTWQFAAQAGGSIGEKGMLTAAKVLALTAIKAMQDPALLRAAKEEFVAQIGGSYVCPLPDDVVPERGEV